jgi:hypothetical protein
MIKDKMRQIKAMANEQGAAGGRKKYSLYSSREWL